MAGMYYKCQLQNIDCEVTQVTSGYNWCKHLHVYTL